MSVRWMAVQYVGSMLRLPIVNKTDMDRPFGSSRLEREVERIVVNPFSDNPQTFTPENAELLKKIQHQADELTHLRMALEERNGDLRAYKKQACRLVVENIKLRELVRDSVDAYEGVAGLLHDGPTKNAVSRAANDLHERMREFGIKGWRE